MNNFCEVCGSNNGLEIHHLVFGRGERKLCDQDKLTITLCHNCHNTIHNHCRVCKEFSRKLGEQMWIINQLSDKEKQEELKEKFLRRYHKNYL